MTNEVSGTELLEQEKVIFYDQKTEQQYLQWLNQLKSKVEKLSESYNQFAEKIGIDPFSANTLKELMNSNPEQWATNKINDAASKFDIPLRPHYLEYYWKQWNEIKAFVTLVSKHFENTSYSVTNRIPLQLISLYLLPEIENGKLLITDEFLESTKPFFETKVSTDNEAFQLLDQFLQTYNALYEIGKDKGVMILPVASGRAEGIHILTPIETFLQRRNDGTVTINNDTLNQLIK